MNKYPVLPSIAIVALALAAGVIVYHVVLDQLNPTPIPVVADPSQFVGPPTPSSAASPGSPNTSSLKQLPVPVATALVQVCGLFATLMLVFFPIQSAAFHQAKKHLLDEILAQLSRYEQVVQEVFDEFFKHQTEERETALYDASRAKVSQRQKLSQALRDRICLHLPGADGKALQEISGKWWSTLLGENGWVMSKSKRMKANDPHFVEMAAIHRKFIMQFGLIRNRCIFEEIKYWKKGKNCKDV